MVFNEDKYYEGLSDEEVCAISENPNFWKKVEREELKYFTNHIPELVKKIKSAVKDIVETMHGMTVSTSRETAIFALGIYGCTFHAITPNDTEGLKAQIIKNLNLQLTLLKSKAPKEYKAILKFIDETIKKIFVIPKSFAQVIQGTATNKLTKINTSKDKTAVKDPFTNSLKITRENFCITIHDYMTSKGLRQSTHQLFDALLGTYTTSGGHSELITLPLKEYMTMRELKDEKSTRQQVKEDLETLSRVKIDFSQKLRGRKKNDYFDLGIIQPSKGIKNGIITVNLDSVFHRLLGGYKPMPYPSLLWKLSENHNPHAFYFLRKISEHKFMNAGKTNEDTLSVLALLETSPNMATYEEVAKTDRHYDKRIITPFENDMDALGEVITWEYCHSSGIPLTDKELSAMNYEIFRKLYVKIYWRVYPDQTERLVHKALMEKKNSKPIKRQNKGGKEKPTE